MHDGMPYGRNQGQGHGHSREVDRQSPTGLIFILFFNTTFLGAMQICIARTSYGNVFGWLAGWLGGCLSQPVLYQND